MVWQWNTLTLGFCRGRADPSCSTLTPCTLTTEGIPPLSLIHLPVGWPEEKQQTQGEYAMVGSLRYREPTALDAASRTKSTWSGRGWDPSSFSLTHTALASHLTMTPWTKTQESKHMAPVSWLRQQTTTLLAVSSFTLAAIQSWKHSSCSPHWL